MSELSPLLPDIALCTRRHAALSFQYVLISKRFVRSVLGFEYDGPCLQ